MPELSSHIVQLEEEIARLKKELHAKQSTEEQLKQSLHLIQSLFNSSTDAIFLFDPSYQLLCFNEAAITKVSTRRHFQLRPGILITAFLEKEEIQLLSQLVKQCNKGKRITEEFKTLRNIWLRCMLSPVYNPDSSLLGYVLSVRDITVKKEAKEQLKLSQFSIDRASEAMFWVASDASIVRVNRAACKLLGYTEEELKQKKVFDIDKSLTSENWAAHWQELRGKKAISFESVHLSKDNREILTLNNLSFFEYKGEEYNFVLTKDITEQKKIEADIRQSEELYKEIVENAPEAIMILDLDSRKFIDCNENALQLFKIEKADLSSLSLESLRPVYQPSGMLSSELEEKHFMKVLQGERFAFDWMHQDSQGNPIMCEVRLSKLFWRGKTLIRASLVDITERKDYETKLLESEQRYKALYERIPDAVYSLDREGNFISGNPALAQLAELPLESLLGKSFIPFIVPEDLERTLYYFNRTWQGFNDAYEIDVITGKGNRKSIHVTSIPIIINEEIVSIYATAKDITESKNYTNNIRKIVQLLNNIYESISDAFFSVDRDWNYTIVNKEYEKISGLSRENILGKNYWEVTPGAKGSKYSQYFFTAMDTQQAINYEIYWEPVWYGVSVYPFEGGISVHIRDITANKQAERKIRDSLHEKEILLAEIHHRVKNNLAVISSLLQLQSYNVEDESVSAALQESTSRIQSIALVHEKLYKSETFSNIPMREYIAELVEQIGQSYELSIPVKVQIEVEQVALDISKSVPCGLILNELISNAYKHAFQGLHEGIIWIRFSKVDDEFELCIKDNGRGLPADFNPETPNSMGLQLVRMLTEQLEGEVTIFSNGGVQTVIRFGAY